MNCFFFSSGIFTLGNEKIVMNGNANLQNFYRRNWKCKLHQYFSRNNIYLNFERIHFRHEIAVGCVSLFCLSSVTGIVSWYSLNGGTLLTVYYRCNEYGWLWFFLQVPIVFMYQVWTCFKSVDIWNFIFKSSIFQDYLTYLIHRMYHTPWFYERFHKIHHKYKQPTAFSVTAIHVHFFVLFLNNVSLIYNIFSFVFFSCSFTIRSVASRGS